MTAIHKNELRIYEEEEEEGMMRTSHPYIQPNK
jgi:hypothetical protein